MKLLVLAALSVVIGIATARPEDTDASQFDNVDVDLILKNERLLKNYFNCLMDRGSCIPEAEDLKKLLPNALSTGCKKCSEKQKAGARKVINFLIDNKRAWWDELEAKYDKDGQYRKQFKDVIEKEGLKL